MKLDYVIEIILDREIAKKRIMGRRLCATDNNHPNNIYIDAIKPAEKDGKMVCRVCGCDKLTARADDQDEAAIDKRHGIYYDTKTGTLAAVNYFKEARPGPGGRRDARREGSLRGPPRETVIVSGSPADLSYDSPKSPSRHRKGFLPFLFGVY